MSSVVVVGSTMTDMITYVNRAPGPGETIVGDRYVVGFGGKGANQAVMSRYLGSSVAMVNCLGEDANGKAYLKRFEEVGVQGVRVWLGGRGEREHVLGRAVLSAVGGGDEVQDGVVPVVAHRHRRQFHLLEQ